LAQRTMEWDNFGDNLGVVAGYGPTLIWVLPKQCVCKAFSRVRAVLEVLDGIGGRGGTATQRMSGALSECVVGVGFECRVRMHGQVSQHVYLSNKANSTHFCTVGSGCCGAVEGKFECTRTTDWEVPPCGQSLTWQGCQLAQGHTSQVSLRLRL